MPTFAEIRETLELLDDWEERYRYLIDLGRTLEPLPEDAHTEDNKVRGCASQVWLETRREPGAEGPVLHFRGDSDALIVKGLVAVAIALYSGRDPRSIVETDALATFDQLGLRANLSPQRSNGLRSMVERMRADARAAMAA
jgi:cysteine desulfuration protein SufE